MPIRAPLRLGVLSAVLVVLISPPAATECVVTDPGAFPIDARTASEAHDANGPGQVDRELVVLLWIRTGETESSGREVT